MSKRWFYNFCAVCVVILFCAALLTLSGCTSLDVKKEGDNWDVSYDALFRDLKDLHVKIDKEDGVNVHLGSAETSDEVGDVLEGWNLYNQCLDDIRAMSCPN
jgi:hypothetical protein